MSTVQVCPECKTHRIAYRSNKFTRQEINPGDQYRCRDCSHTFDKPDERERRATSDGTNGLAKVLADMDPEEFPV
jgi:transposase-like protein